MMDHHPECPVPRLPSHDIGVLAEVGLTIDAAKAAAATAVTAQQIRHIADTALTIDGAADHLGATAEIVRRRITDRALWAYTPGAGRGWMLPAAQFTATGMVPHLGSIIGLVPADMSPLAFHRLLTLPQPDLILDGQLLSLIDWLTACGGRSRMLSQAMDLVRAAVFDGY